VRREREGKTYRFYGLPRERAYAEAKAVLLRRRRNRLLDKVVRTDAHTDRHTLTVTLTLIVFCLGAFPSPNTY